MTDHLDEAAARASELAGELDRDDPTAVTNAQRHLIYLAGLLRGSREGSGVNEVETARVFSGLYRDAELEVERLVRERDQAHAQRDELRRAISDFLERVDPDLRDMRLHGALAQVEREIEGR